MKIKTFIEKAIEGGWNKDYEFKYFAGLENDGVFLKHRRIKTAGKSLVVSEIFLDPKAWEAVGKVKGWECSQWKYRTDKERADGVPDYERDTWTNKMNGMTPALIEGKSIEEYLETLN